MKSEKDNEQQQQQLRQQQGLRQRRQLWLRWALPQHYVAATAQLVAAASVTRLCLVWR